MEGNAQEQDWYSPWRLFTPWDWDINLSKWEEPSEPEGQLAPYMHRVCYYLATRHPVLTCVFVKEKDSFSRNERIAALLVTVLNTWWVSVLLTAGFDGDNSIGTKIGLAIATAIFTVPFTILFQICSRIQCCNCEWGRIITVPLAILHLALAIAATVQSSSILAKVAVIFFGGLAYDWVLQKPYAIYLRVWLYGRGWNKWIGIGRKSKWFSDSAVSSTGLG